MADRFLCLEILANNKNQSAERRVFNAPLCHSGEWSLPRAAWKLWAGSKVLQSNETHNRYAGPELSIFAMACLEPAAATLVVHYILWSAL